jgi:hypothetical protein
VASVATPRQNQWFACRKCRAVFFAGFDFQGYCPAGGPHERSRSHLELPYVDERQGDSRGYQVNWRYCRRCAALFYNGFPSKGACPAGGGGHLHAGYNFSLRHDWGNMGQAAASNHRFCDKCFVMFYTATLSGMNDVCQRGGAHRAAGYMFNLDI